MLERHSEAGVTRDRHRQADVGVFFLASRPILSGVGCGAWTAPLRVIPNHKLAQLLFPLLTPLKSIKGTDGVI